MFSHISTSKIEHYQKVLKTEFIREFHALVEAANKRTEFKADFTDKILSLVGAVTSAGISTASVHMPGVANVISKGLSWVIMKQSRARKEGKAQYFLSEGFEHDENALEILADAVAIEASKRNQSYIQSIDESSVVGFAKTHVERMLEYVARTRLPLNPEYLLDGLVRGRSGGYVQGFFNTQLKPTGHLAERIQLSNKIKDKVKKKFGFTAVTAEGISARSGWMSIEMDDRNNFFWCFYALVERKKARHIIEDKAIENEKLFNHGWTKSHPKYPKEPKCGYSIVSKEEVKKYFDHLPTHEQKSFESRIEDLSDSMKTLLRESKLEIIPFNKDHLSAYLNARKNKPGLTLLDYLKNSLQQDQARMAFYDTQDEDKDLSDLVLSGAILEDAVFNECSFPANLDDTSLKRSYLRHADFNQVISAKRLDLREAHAEYLQAAKADLSGANLRGTNLFGADLSEATLQGVDLLGAVLVQAQISEATYTSEENEKIQLEQKRQIKLLEKQRQKLRLLEKKYSAQAEDLKRWCIELEEKVDESVVMILQERQILAIQERYYHSEIIALKTQQSLFEEKSNMHEERIQNLENELKKIQEQITKKPINPYSIRKILKNYYFSPEPSSYFGQKRIVGPIVQCSYTELTYNRFKTISSQGERTDIFQNDALIKYNASIAEEKSSFFDDIRSVPVDITDKVLLENILHDFGSIKLTEKRKQRVLYFEGQPGIGKSSLCAYLANQWAKDKSLPGAFELLFWIEFKKLTSSESESNVSYEVIFEYNPIKNIINYEQRSEFVSYLENSKNKILFILDGYDVLGEVASDPPARISELLKMPNVILTSRPGYSSIHEKGYGNVTLYFKIDGFASDKQVTEYISKYFRSSVCIAKGESELDLKEDNVTELAITKSPGYFIEKLRANSALWEMARIPLQLMIMCSLQELITTNRNTLPLSAMFKIYDITTELQLSDYLMCYKKKPATYKSEVYRNEISKKLLCFVGGFAFSNIIDLQQRNQGIQTVENFSEMKHELYQSGVVFEEKDAQLFLQPGFQNFFAANHLTELVKIKFKQEKFSAEQQIEKYNELLNKWVEQCQYTPEYHIVTAYAAYFLADEGENLFKQYWDLIFGTYPAIDFHQDSLKLRILEIIGLRLNVQPAEYYSQCLKTFIEEVFKSYEQGINSYFLARNIAYFYRVRAAYKMLLQAINTFRIDKGQLVSQKMLFLICKAALSEKFDESLKISAVNALCEINLAEKKLNDGVIALIYCWMQWEMFRKSIDSARNSGEEAKVALFAIIEHFSKKEILASFKEFLLEEIPANKLGIPIIDLNDIVKIGALVLLLSVPSLFWDGLEILKEFLISQSLNKKHEVLCTGNFKILDKYFPFLKEMKDLNLIILRALYRVLQKNDFIGVIKHLIIKVNGNPAAVSCRDFLMQLFKENIDSTHPAYIDALKEMEPSTGTINVSDNKLDVKEANIKDIIERLKSADVEREDKHEILRTLARITVVPAELLSEIIAELSKFSVFLQFSEEMYSQLIKKLIDPNFHLRLQVAQLLELSISDFPSQYLFELRKLKEDKDEDVRYTMTLCLNKIKESSLDLVDDVIFMLKDPATRIRVLASNALKKLMATDTSYHEKMRAFLELPSQYDLYKGEENGELNEKRLRTISRENNNAILLIKHADQVSVYGFVNNKWQITSLDPKDRATLKKVWVDKSALTPELRSIIDKCHSPLGFVSADADTQELSVQRNLAEILVTIDDSYQSVVVPYWSKILEPESIERFDLFLMSIGDEEKLDERTLPETSKKYNNAAILIKNGEKFSIYGLIDDTWKKTDLKEKEVLKNLPFENEKNQLLDKHDPLLTPDIIKILRNGHLGSTQAVINEKRYVINVLKNIKNPDSGLVRQLIKLIDVPKHSELFSEVLVALVKIAVNMEESTFREEIFKTIFKALETRDPNKHYMIEEALDYLSIKDLLECYFSESCRFYQSDAQKILVAVLYCRWVENEQAITFTADKFVQWIEDSQRIPSSHPRFRAYLEKERRKIISSEFDTKYASISSVTFFTVSRRASVSRSMPVSDNSTAQMVTRA
jgi:hypothetical protein